MSCTLGIMPAVTMYHPGLSSGIISLEEFIVRHIELIFLLLSPPKEVASQLLSSFSAQQWAMKKRVLRGDWWRCESQNPRTEGPFCLWPASWVSGCSSLSWKNSSDSRFTTNQLKQPIFGPPIDTSPYKELVPLSIASTHCTTLSLGNLQTLFFHIHSLNTLLLNACYALGKVWLFRE